MSNGFTTEQMLDKIWEDVKETRKKVEHIVENGCPLGKAHDARIASLERWRTRGIVGVISGALSALGYHLFAK